MLRRLIADYWAGLLIVVLLVAFGLMLPGGRAWGGTTQENTGNILTAADSLTALFGKLLEAGGDTVIHVETNSGVPLAVDPTYDYGIHWFKYGQAEDDMAVDVIWTVDSLGIADISEWESGVTVFLSADAADTIWIRAYLHPSCNADVAMQFDSNPFSVATDYFYKVIAGGDPVAVAIPLAGIGQFGGYSSWYASCIGLTLENGAGTVATNVKLGLVGRK